MKRALCATAMVVGFVGFAAAPANAYEAPDPVVWVTVGDDNVGVYSGLPGQPLLGARVDVGDAKACVGFSYQVPQCVQVGPISVSDLP